MSVICLHAKGKLEAAVAVEKKRKKKKRGETCRTIEGALNDVSYPRLCQWQ